MRQFLSYEAAGVTPVEFFEIWNGVNGSDPSYSFVDYDGASFIPRPGYTALAGLMSDVKSIAQPAITSYSASTLSSVAVYSGTFPLLTMHMVGAREGAKANSDALVLWQLTSCSQGNSCWFSINLGAGGPVTVNIPSGMSVTAVRNLTTTADVSYKQNGQQISFNVADDPIEILTDPTSADIPTSSRPLLQQTSLKLQANPGSSSYGSQVLITALVTPSTSKSKSTDNEVVSFFDGATPISSGRLASGVVSINTTSLTVGTHNLRAVYGGDANFGGSSGALSFNVGTASSNLTFQPVADQVYGTATVGVSAKSLSTGATTYSVVSGPARVTGLSPSGATLTLTGAGQVVVKATQQATASYAALTAQTSFTVAQATPKISFLPIATQTYGNRAVYVTAGSASRGAFTFSILSGPAKISGNAITPTGAGTVVIQATQAAVANYTSATATTSFNVLLKTPQMSMKSIATQVFGAAPAALSATSTSTAPIVYTIVSGPGAIVGNTVAIQGAGAIVVQASQAATTQYSAISARVHFNVNTASPKLTLGSLATQTYGGPAISLQTNSLSSGQVTYKVLTGPASVSGNNLVLNGIGFVVVQAIQAGTANYAAASAQTSFRINPGTPTLSLQPVADQSGLTAPFRVTATSNSTGAISYKVLGGPAKVSGNIVTVTGFGNVTLQAVLGASSTYVGATANTSFVVLPTAADVQ